MPHDDDRLITLREAARRLGIGLRAIYRARDQGELPVYEVDAWPRVRVGDARAWLERHRRGGPLKPTESGR